MQIVKLSLSLPDATHPNMQLHVCSEEADCDVVIELPIRAKGSVTQVPGASMTAQDEYALGGYAGI